MTHPKIAEVREIHHRLAVLADRVTDEGADLPESLIARVLDDEETAARILRDADPTATSQWDKARQIAEDAFLDALDDAPSRTDWAWPA